MGPDIVRRLALLTGVEEPRGAEVGRAGDGLHQVVHALHVDGGLGVRTRTRSPNTAGSFTSARAAARDLEALGHDVVGDELARRPRPAPPRASADLPTSGSTACRPELEPAPDDATMRSIFSRVAAREDDHVPGRSLSMRSKKSGLVCTSSSHEVGLSARRLNRRRVQVIEEVPARAARRHPRAGDARVHLLLDERRVKVPGSSVISRTSGRRPTLLSAQCAPHGHRNGRPAP